MRPNITELVVEKDRCIGCGVCSAVCPVDILKMNIGPNGVFQPKEYDGCLASCSLCMQACPFLKDNYQKDRYSKKLYSNHKNIGFYKDIGYFDSTYEIHKKNDISRIESASGGALHWISSTLLLSKEIDFFITIESSEKNSNIFKFTVFTSSEFLSNTPGSVYYPLDISEVLKYIIENDGLYAISVLPCYAKAIRLAQEKNTKLRKRIKYLVGLVCGQMKSIRYTELICNEATGSEKVCEVDYRLKNKDRLSNDFSLFFKNKSGKEGVIDRKELPATLWSNRVFTPNACNYCNDVFCLSADIVSMDAWLPEYIVDYKGHSLVIDRVGLIKDIKQEYKDNISINVINVKKVWRSQKNVIISKKSYFKTPINPIRRRIVRYRKLIQKLSNSDYKGNKSQINELIDLSMKYEKYMTILSIPRRALNKLYRMLRNE